MVIMQMMVYVDVKLTLFAILPLFFIAFGEYYYGQIVEKRFTEAIPCEKRVILSPTANIGQTSKPIY